VKLPIAVPVPIGLVRAIVPEALPAAVYAVIDIELLIVNEPTGRPPKGIEVTVPRLDPVIAMAVPATPEVGVNSRPDGRSPPVGVEKLNNPPGATNSTVAPLLFAAKVTVILPLEEEVSESAVIVVLFTTVLTGTFIKLRPTRTEDKVYPAFVNPVQVIVISVPAEPDVGVHPVTAKA